MVENKRIKMKAANKKKKRIIKQKQQQKQVVTQNVKVIVGSRPRAKSTAPRSTPAKQPNIISISMPQAQQPVYNPIASNYYEEEMNRVRARQQAEYDSLLNNPLAQNIKINQNKVERNENKLVKAGILPNLTAEPVDKEKLNDMLIGRLNKQRRDAEKAIQRQREEEQDEEEEKTRDAFVFPGYSFDSQERTRDAFASPRDYSRAGGPGGAGANPHQQEIDRLRGLGDLEFKNLMTTTGDKIYKVAKSLGITYTVNQKRIGVAILRPMIEHTLDRTTPKISRGRQAGSIVLG